MRFATTVGLISLIFTPALAADTSDEINIMEAPPVPAWESSELGDTIIVPLDSAPFPH